MTPAPSPVPIDPRTLAAHGLSPGELAAAFPGTVIVLPDGEALRVTAGGALDPVVTFGRRSIASDPAAHAAGLLVVMSPSGYTGTPGNDAFTVKLIDKATSGFSYYLAAAPGAGNSITFDVVFLRVG